MRTTQEYDALNRIRKALYPKDLDNQRKVLEPAYNKGGALESLRVNGSDIVLNTSYNARGQRIMQAMANGLMTRYAYDPETFRLARTRAEKFTKTGTDYTGNGGIRLDRAYSYDLEGSVTRERDKTPADNASRGPGSLERTFVHDPLRRLISATGRESTGAIPTPPWDLNTRPEDPTATNTYTRNYAYDNMGNVLSLQHIANGQPGNNFTRNFNYAAGHADNKLTGFTVGSNTYAYHYDQAGNVIAENTDRHFAWNHADKLAFFKRQAGGGSPSLWAHYLYDGEGNRVKKVVNKAGGIQEVAVYIDGLFAHCYTKQNGSVDNTRHYTNLNVVDGTSRIATLRTGNDADDPTPAQKLYVEDHLGSCSVVVTASGNRINLEEFYPFGQTSFGSYAKKRYRYNGKEKDEESGLYEYGQRYYAPWVCRFVSVDPVAEKFSDLSAYNYAGNRPITKVDMEGLQEENRNEQPKQNPQQGTGKSVTYRTPAGDTFRDPNIHNTATAEGQSEVITTAGVMVPTRTNALLQFDYKGETYKAHFSSKTLDFTNYKTEEGKKYPIPHSEGPYTADLNLTVSENKPGMLTFNAEVSGNEDWVWNNTRFSFDIPVKFEYGLTLDQDIPSIPSSVNGKSAFIGHIIFQDLDQDLPSLLEGIRFEYIENSVGPDANYVELNVGNNVLKGTDKNFNTVIRAMQYTGTFGFKAPSKINETIDQLGSMNPTPYDVKLGWKTVSKYKFENPPTKTDSLAHGF